MDTLAQLLEEDVRMSLLRPGAWIDGRTGEQHVAYSDESPNAHAVSAESDVYAPDPSPGHDDGLPAGVLLVIDTRLDLEPYRLERGGSAREHGYADTHHELKAAFEHPRVTRERVAEGIEPPERGRRLALYDALAWWIGHVEREWRVPDLGEVMIGPADECLEPVLLDLHYEWSVALSHQCHHWLRGTYQRIPESAAREAERCLRAALDTCRHALWLSLDDQIGAIKARENSASLVWGLCRKVPKSGQRSHDPPPDSHPISAIIATLPTPIPRIHFHSPGTNRDKTTANTTSPTVSQVTFGTVGD